MAQSLCNPVLAEQLLAAAVLSWNGAGGTRTHDLRFRKPSLYPAELQPHGCQPIASGGPT